jgi:uncharacterized protein (TIGR00288 family)
MALFCDFENVALGVKDAKYKQFDINKVLERLLLKGSIVVKKAYCDWERYREFKATMHQASFELIEIPHVRMSGKNSADIRMVVDALDLCYTKAHVDTFVIISGDSDFSPLVSKLRENNKTVIGVGVKNSTSDLLIANCDEFIYYDDLVRDQVFARPARSRGRGEGARAAGRTEGAAARAEAGPAKGEAGAGKGESAAAAPVPGTAARKPTARGRGKQGAEPAVARGAAVLTAAPPAAAPPAADVPGESVDNGLAPASVEQLEETRDRASEAIELVVGTIEALAAERGADEKIWGSMVKQTLKRRRPGFNETYYGFRSFNRLLEEARDRGLIQLELDDKSGGYTVRCLD